ncbi:hypothetical protein LCGC14_0709570 [marine sediment metagenome]|uniref:Uncharacterized protein n=1 Tax=marine sediment metagenome TaxID=412755 RepID=A0A0F9QFJ5_9ZZZZ
MTAYVRRKVWITQSQISLFQHSSTMAIRGRNSLSKPVERACWVLVAFPVWNFFNQRRT